MTKRVNVSHVKLTWWVFFLYDMMQKENVKGYFKRMV